MILDYLWRYPPYIILLIMVDLVSVSYPPVFLIPRSMVVEWSNHMKNILAIAPPASFRYSDVVCTRCLIAVTSPDCNAYSTAQLPADLA